MIRTLLFAAAILPLAISQSASLGGETFSGRVVTVIDGDTIGVLIGDKEVRIRLEGIDAPERAQEGGPAATRFLRSLVDNQEVTIQQTGTDKYGRMLGIVSTKDGSVNSKMLESGWAWHFKKYNSDEKFAGFEEKARLTRRGIWQASISPTPPWEYRQRNKLQEPGTSTIAESIPGEQSTLKAAGVPADELASTPLEVELSPEPATEKDAQPAFQEKQIPPVAQKGPAPSKSSVIQPFAGNINPSKPAASGTTKPKSSKSFEESEAEKAYEKANGVEVVHRKDGTTYERRQPGMAANNPKTSTPSFSAPSSGGGSGSSKSNFKESAAEKAYEKAKGVEVVHRKDGTTYERKARSKK